MISRVNALIRVPPWTPSANQDSFTAAQIRETWKGGGMKIPRVTVLTQL